jgi:hypothetical protein
MDINSTANREPIKFHPSLYLTPHTSPRQRSTHPLATHAVTSLPPTPHLPPCPLSTLTHASRAPSGQLPYQDAAASGTMCSMRIIQCSAATQDTRLALASSDTKMSAGHQLPIESPPSSPFCSKSYADFVTDKELLQANADVEECYRRRARRAGLEEMLPVGRPMTDEEIDDLSQRLGDWEPANGFRSRRQSAAGR